MQRGKADVADTRPLFSTLSYYLNSVSHTAGGYGDGCAGFYRFCAAALETGKIGKKQKWRKAQKAQNLSTWLLRFLYVFLQVFERKSSRAARLARMHGTRAPRQAGTHIW